jgi:alpha-galactosidase
VEQIAGWAEEYKSLTANDSLAHNRSGEYASHIMESLITGVPYKIGGNVINNGVIENLPREACVEVPCMVDNYGIHPCYVGRLPVQLAAMNMTHVNVHLVTIEAAVTLKKEHVYHAAMLEPHIAAELSIDDIRSMVDDLIAEHGNWMPKYK